MHELEEQYLKGSVRRNIRKIHQNADLPTKGSFLEEKLIGGYTHLWPEERAR